MWKSQSIKETKGNPVVFLKAASDNVPKHIELHSTSKGVELGGISAHFQSHRKISIF